MDLEEELKDFDQFLEKASPESITEITKIMNELAETIDIEGALLPDKQKALLGKARDKEQYQVAMNQEQGGSGSKDGSFRDQWNKTVTFCMMFSKKLHELERKEKDKGGVEAFFSAAAKEKIQSGVMKIFRIMENMQSTVQKIRKEAGGKVPEDPPKYEEEKPSCSKPQAKKENGPQKNEDKYRKMKMKKMKKKKEETAPEKKTTLHLKLNRPASSTSQSFGNPSTPEVEDQPKTESPSGQKADLKKKKKRTPNQQLRELLSGERSWMLDRISLESGTVICGRIRMILSDFKTAVKYSPWILFPMDYEVECHGCSMKVPLTTLGADKMSVHCDLCNGITLLGEKEDKYQWVLFYECRHYSNIEINEGAMSVGDCPTCGVVGGYCVGYDEDTRMPTVKENRAQTSSPEQGPKVPSSQ